MSSCSSRPCCSEPGLFRSAESCSEDWWSAPKGCGFLQARGDRRTDLHPVTISHGYGAGFTKEFDWVGTTDPTAYLALPAALDFFERLGGKALMERNKRLAAETPGQS